MKKRNQAEQRIHFLMLSLSLTTFNILSDSQYCLSLTSPSAVSCETAPRNKRLVSRKLARRLFVDSMDRMDPPDYGSASYWDQRYSADPDGSFDWQVL